MQKFHERLAYALDKKGISNLDLAKETGLHSVSISNYRTGKQSPRIEFMWLLKKLIPDLNTNWLFYEEGDPFFDEPEDGPGKEPLRHEEEWETGFQPDREGMSVEDLGLTPEPVPMFASAFEVHRLERKVDGMAHLLSAVAEKVGVDASAFSTLSDTPIGVPTQVGQPGGVGENFGQQGAKHRQLQPEPDETDIREVRA